METGPYYCCNCHQRFSLSALMAHLREAHNLKPVVMAGHRPFAPLAWWRYVVGEVVIDEWRMEARE